jgi:hypothetical protein
MVDATGVGSRAGTLVEVLTTDLRILRMEEKMDFSEVDGLLKIRFVPL